MKEKLLKALLDLKQKRITAKEAGKNKKAYTHSEKGLALAKSKKEADALERSSKKTVFDIAVEMVKEKIDLDYGVKKTKTSEKETLVYTDAEAVKYCLEYHLGALMANRSVLDSILENMDTLPDFVTKEITPSGFSITIPTDLSEIS